VSITALLVICLGIDIEYKVALVAVVVAFLLFYNTRDGLRDIGAGAGPVSAFGPISFSA
jgi:ABC-type nitrate/sulfonate/bicarbonate transport system permease component